MQEKFTVRLLQKGDTEAILELAMKSWKYTYEHIFKISFIENYVKRAYRKEGLENIIEQSEKGFCKFFVLEENYLRTLVGFAQIGYNNYWETGKKILPLRLFRIYLDPQQIGKGLGKLLLNQVEHFIQEEGYNDYIVGVHERNTIGLRFYEKMGFKAISKKSDAEGEIYFSKSIN